MICLIVEGKNDVKKIQEVIEQGVHFIILEGINFSKERCAEIQSWLEKKLPIYILTDPDDAGDGVASLIQQKFPTIERISVQPEKARILKSKGYKYGVEYCSRKYIHSLIGPRIEY